MGSIIHLFLVLVVVILVGLSPLTRTVLLINLSDMWAAVVVPLDVVVVHWLVTPILFLFILLVIVVLIVTHVFLVLVLFDGLGSDHVVVVHYHMIVVALVLSLLILFLIVVVLVVIHILGQLLHLLVLVFLEEQLLLLVLLERGLRREVAWEVGSRYVQAIVVLGTQQ
jgi:hypothetical protein